MNQENQKTKQIGSDGGAGGDVRYIAGPIDRRNLDDVVNDTGPFVVRFNETAALVLSSDGRVVVHGREIGVSREIYPGFRAFCHSMDTVTSDGPEKGFDEAGDGKAATLNGEALPPGVPVPLENRLGAMGAMVMSPGVGGDSLDGGRKGRDGRFILEDGSKEEILRLESDGGVHVNGLPSVSSYKIMEALARFVEKCGLSLGDVPEVSGEG